MIHVRPYAPDDRAFLLSLAARLIIGLPPWRDHQLAIAAFEKWILVSIEQLGQKTMVLVAEDDQGERSRPFDVSVAAGVERPFRFSRARREIVRLFGS